MDDETLIIIVCVILFLLSLAIIHAIRRANELAKSCRNSSANSSDLRTEQISQIEHPDNNLQSDFTTSESYSDPVDGKHLRYEQVTVLAVDDNPLSLRFVCTLLEDLGVETTSARSGEEAISITSETSFDLILMDVQMPGMNGIETMKRIHVLEESDRKTPIIALSAHSLPDEIMRLLNAGMNDCVVKPISERQLKATLEKWTKTTRSTQALSPVPEKLIVDWDWSLKLANNKPELVLELLTILKETLPEDQAAMNSAYRSGNTRLLKQVLHRLKGAVAYCGVPGLRDAIEHFETVLNSDNASRAQSDLDSVNREIEALIAWEAGREQPGEPL